jgi:hypothetical protein
MAVTHNVLRQYKDTSANALQKPETISADIERNVSIALAAQTDAVIDFRVTQSKLQSLCLTASQATTVLTNAPSTGVPQDTINLTAGEVLIWTLAMDTLPACPFKGDVTALFVTTTATSTQLDVRSLQMA